MRILILESYYGGSHRALVDGLAERLPVSVRRLTLPARKWKWRMRGAAFRFIEMMTSEPVPDVIFASTIVSLAELRGMLPPGWRNLPLVAYFHENQVAYPTRHADARDFQYPITNLTSALAADQTLWNSRYNLTSFCDGIEEILRAMPDERPADAVEQVRRTARILPVPIDATGIGQAARAVRQPLKGPPTILWNHRWEHDKDPKVFFAALFQLADRGVPFQVLCLGERFRESPAIFRVAKERLQERLHCPGFLPLEEYVRAMATCHVAVSTARHEFQGLAMLEAAAAGCFPLVPDALAYPEIWPEACRYQRENLVPALQRALDRAALPRPQEVNEAVAAHDWSHLLPRYFQVLERAAGRRC